MGKKRFSLKARIKSFGYAINGIRHLISTEHNAWIHCFAAIAVTIAGFALHISAGEWVAVVLCFGSVFAAEAFNTAIEMITDYISPGFDKKAGLIKDLAAGGVLFTALAAAIAGCIIFIPKIAALC